MCMKKICKIVLTCFAISLLVLLGAGTTKAAESKVTGVKQTDASSTSIDVECDSQLGFSDYYILQLSNDGVSWANAAYSSSCTGLSEYGLNSGKTYYARIALADDSYGKNIRNYSDRIEVVTAPDTSKLKVYQSDATTSSISMTGVGAVGANYYQIVYNGRILGASRSPKVTTSVRLSPGARYWL